MLAWIFQTFLMFWIMIMLWCWICCWYFQLCCLGKKKQRESEHPVNVGRLGQMNMSPGSRIIYGDYSNYSRIEVIPINPCSLWQKATTNLPSDSLWDTEQTYKHTCLVNRHTFVCNHACCLYNFSRKHASLNGDLKKKLVILQILAVCLKLRLHYYLL